MNYKSNNTLYIAVLDIAKHWAEARSKDPSTKVGAAVYNCRTGAMHLGYNGFPAGFPDDKSYWDNRDEKLNATKYDLVVHAEVNAIRKAWRAGEDTDSGDCILICTHVPCANCMRDVVAPSGIKVVMYGTADYASNTDHNAYVRDLIAKECSIHISKMEK